MKKKSIYKNENPVPDSYSRNKIKVELDFSNYATKSEVKKKLKKPKKHKKTVADKSFA